MAAARTADDKFLALLALEPSPMGTTDIAEKLAWSRQNVRSVGARLEREGRVERVKGEGDGTTGRPADAWALAGTGGKLAVVSLKKLKEDTIVVTPSGEEARVIGPAGRSFVEFEYITGPERFQRGTLHISLLREFQPGRGRPDPVRIVEKVA